MVIHESLRNGSAWSMREGGAWKHQRWWSVRASDILMSESMRDGVA